MQYRFAVWFGIGNLCVERKMTITLTREEAQQVLDALEEAQSYTSCETWSPSMTEVLRKQEETLRARLAQPEPEPVAWFSKRPDNTLAIKIVGKPTEGDWEPLYTAPPHREWQSLTHEEKMEILTRSITAPSRIDVAEAMLKEKNNG
jgi:hypothetical protein